MTDDGYMPDRYSPAATGVICDRCGVGVTMGSRCAACSREVERALHGGLGGDRDVDALRTAVESRAGQSDLACVPVPLAQLRAALRALDERTHGVWRAAVDMVDDARVEAWGEGDSDEATTYDVPADRWRALVDAVAAARGYQ